MKITVKCFALARQLVEDDTVSVELTEGSTVDDLKKELALRFPQMDRVLNSSMIAVDGDYVPGQPSTARDGRGRMYPTSKRRLVAT